MINYDDYYQKFLCAGSALRTNGRLVSSCERRSNQYAFYYIHHLIAANVSGEILHSVSPIFVNDYSCYIQHIQAKSIDNELLKEIDDVFFKLLPPFAYSVKHMKRMTTTELNKHVCEDLQITRLGESHIPEVYNLPNRGKLYTEYMWEAKIDAVEAGQYFIGLVDGEIATSAFITDIDYRGANIAVGTRPKFRNRGYGKVIVSHLTEWCISNGYLPIYLVDSNNVPSIKLAQSLGYEVKSDEIVVYTYKDQ